MTNEELVKRYAEAIVSFDYDTLDRLRHPQWTASWPQSGETVHGSRNSTQIMQNYPGGAPRLLMQGGRIVGSEDRWAVSPLGGVYRVAGEGENWWGEWRMAYPDGRIWSTVILVELRDGKIFHETQYWCEPFEAPAWRAAWTERAPTS
jgi:hypothetical protein